MPRILLLLLLCARAFAGTTVEMDMNYQNTNRHFILYLPTGYTPGEHLPVVFNLHGYGSDASQQIYYSKMYITADSNHFALVAPDGLNNSWNSGFTPPYNSLPDDVGFISKIIDTLYQLYSVDLTRVYACGMSNGGYQSYRLACDLENRIAAIASVTGTTSTLTAYNCALSRKVPILEIHGTADPLVEYAGATGYYGVEENISFWLGKNQCSVVNDTVFVPDINTSDSSTVQQIRYRTCGSGSEVWLYKIIGGGHSWPSAPISYIYGPTNRDFDASQAIWDFFNKFTLNGAVGVVEVHEAVDVQVYPNPVGEKLEISFANTRIKNAVLQVFDVAGRKVAEQRIEGSHVTLPFASFGKGLYFVKAEGNGFSAVRRVVKEQ
jgi:polyhydroxybutyrate depolymerase